jgi:hypothetical protein
MTRLIIFLTFFIVSINSNAQTKNQPVIAVDKANVLYYGIDNPITIGVPGDIKNAVIKITNGTISGEGMNRIVRPTSLDQNTIITVDINGKSYPFNFRVNRIPDPVFKIGGGKTRLPSVEFIAQQFCRAMLEDSEFNMQFAVESATVHFGGANFPEEITTNLQGNSLDGISTYKQRCGPGSYICFTNIMVKGPDGIRNIADRVFILY